MLSMIGGVLGSSAGKIVYKNLGVIFGMEIAKVFLTNLVAELPGGEVLTVIISWLFGIAQNIVSFIEAIFGFLGALLSIELFGAGANLISLAGTSAQLIVSVIVLVALANLFFRSVAT